MTLRLLLQASLRLSSSLALLLVASALAAHAQQHYDPFDSLGSTTSNVPGYENHGGTTLRVTVFSENAKTRLDRQCLIKLTNINSQNISWQTTDDRSEVGFGDLPSGHYELEVSAVGYLTARREFQAVSSFIPVNLEIVMDKDPAAVDLTFADAAMPARARKETKHGVSALKSGKWDEANKRLAAAYKLAPENPDVNFLLGYLYYQKKELGRASQYLDTAADLSPGNVQTLSLLARVSLEQQDYGRAVSNLEKAIMADSDYWVAHDLLAASYLKQQKFDQARQQAELAISKGKEAATASRLVLGQALINTGQREQGIQTLKDFVASEPKNPSVPQVQAFITQLEAEPVAAVTNPGGASVPQQIAGVDPLVAAAEPTFSVRPWQPPSIDLNKPSVAANASCPADIVERTGKRVEGFVEDVSRIAAIEHLLHEQLDEMGDALTKETRTFNYVASFMDSGEGSIAVDEYRQEHLGLGDFPDHMSSSGFATLALVFHPDAGQFRNELRRPRRIARAADLAGPLQTARRSPGTNARLPSWRRVVFAALERARMDYCRRVPDCTDRIGVDESGSTDPAGRRAPGRRVRPRPLRKKERPTVASTECRDLLRLPAPSLLPKTQFRSLHAVRGGFGRETQSSHGPTC
jgi:tetratricopeptide (TPR) repeat protein